MQWAISFFILENLMHRVGGKKANLPLPAPEREELNNIFGELRKKGFAVISSDDLDKIEIIKHGLLSLDGRQIVLYIYQPYNDIDSIKREVGPRFHLTDCPTLQGMRDAGRYDRYVAHADPSEKFSIRPCLKHGEEWGEETKENLLPCKNCLSQLGLDQSDTAVRVFNLVAFFERHKDLFPASPALPRYNKHTQPTGGYPKDWKRITDKVREESNWVCAQCKVSCKTHRYLLHTHHKNGIPADCSRANLQALCAFCHSKQLYHRSIMKEEDRKAILRLRKEQGLVLD